MLPKFKVGDIIIKDKHIYQITDIFFEHYWFTALTTWKHWDAPIQSVDDDPYCHKFYDGNDILKGLL